MSDDPKETETKTKEESKEETDAEKARILTNIQSVGPKNAEKLVAAGYDTIDKFASADSEELAAAVPGVSTAKAVDFIAAAVSLKAAVEAGEIDLTRKGKKSKRKKAPEPDPDIHELPPAEEIARAEIRSSLKTGLETDKTSMGIPIGPKWLTRFEKARIIGARALQISMGAPVIINMKTAPRELFSLAEAELRAQVLPMTVRRTLPTGEYFDVPLARLLENTRLD
ncbi:MAG: DNA-directed RNA polymerase subunit K [Candidatus Thorarchaeota archaeon]|jgi:DNA-directed RNA polymerase subunit K/omega